MKSKLMLLATAAILVATNAQAGFLTRESSRCASPHPLGIFKPRNAADNTVSSNCDVKANHAVTVIPDPPYNPIGEPGSLIGVPRDTLTPLVQKEIDAAAKQTRPLPAITRNPLLLQYLPDGFFELPEARAAFDRLARIEPSSVQIPSAAGIRVQGSIQVRGQGGERRVPTVYPNVLSSAGFRVLAERLRCLASLQEETVDGHRVCSIENIED